MSTRASRSPRSNVNRPNQRREHNGCLTSGQEHRQECLFDTPRTWRQPDGEQTSIWDDGWQADPIDQRGVESYRERTTYAGDMLFVDCYPVWDTSAKAAEVDELAKAARRDPVVWERHNEKVSKRNFERKLYYNFAAGDLHLTLTYDIKGAGCVVDEEIARRDIRNYTRRLRNSRRRAGLPELKYMYVMEYRESAELGTPDHVHFHIILNAMDRNEAERLWTQYTPHAGWANADRLRPNAEMFAGIVKYLTKHPRGKKRYVCSKNVLAPPNRLLKRRLTRRKAARISADYEQARRYFEKRYKSYAFVDLEIFVSGYCSGAYMYARMRRRD